MEMAASSRILIFDRDPSARDWSVIRKTRTRSVVSIDESATIW
jgi:hypothetical protein